MKWDRSFFLGPVPGSVIHFYCLLISVSTLFFWIPKIKFEDKPFFIWWQNVMPSQFLLWPRLVDCDKYYSVVHVSSQVYCSSIAVVQLSTNAEMWPWCYQCLLLSSQSNWFIDLLKLALAKTKVLNNRIIGQQGDKILSSL